MDGIEACSEAMMARKSSDGIDGIEAQNFIIEDGGVTGIVDVNFDGGGMDDQKPRRLKAFLDVLLKDPRRYR